MNTLYSSDGSLQISNGSRPTGQSGIVRWNSTLSQFEVDIGTSYNPSLTFGVTDVRLSEDMKELISWAKKKMEQDRLIESLVEDHPEIKQMYEKLELAIALCREYD